MTLYCRAYAPPVLPHFSVASVSREAADASTPPMLKHWREVKAQHPDTILFYRVGDFYEMFHEDAELAARVLEITLTSRGDGVPLAGVPVKAAADYLRQLVVAGHRVAICEQVEDPKLARGLVRREVVETVTPGALLQEGWLAGGRNNFLVALAGERDRVGLAAIDLSTGEFLLESLDAAGLSEALGRLGPAEVVLPGDLPVAMEDGVLRTVRERWEFDPELAREDLARRFALATLDGLGLGPEDAPAIGAAGALLRYLTELQPAGLPHLARPLVRRSDAFLWLDEMTRRNLELVEPLRAGARNCTLLETMDATVTPMGGRLLRQWMLSPLRDPASIDYRLDAVEVAVRDGRGRARLREALDGVRDVERLAGRAAAGRATPARARCAPGFVSPSTRRVRSAERARGLDPARAAAAPRRWPMRSTGSTCCPSSPRSWSAASRTGPRRLWATAE